MKQLIPQSKIDEAAKECCEYMPDWLREHDEKFQSLFEEGVQFALKEIEPLMIEFNQFCGKRYELTDPESNIWIDAWTRKNQFTTQQLLEKFINSYD